jgi:hypothetical protein
MIRDIEACGRWVIAELLGYEETPGRVYMPNKEKLPDWRVISVGDDAKVAGVVVGSRILFKASVDQLQHEGVALAFLQPDQIIGKLPLPAEEGKRTTGNGSQIQIVRSLDSLPSLDS